MGVCVSRRLCVRAPNSTKGLQLFHPGLSSMLPSTVIHHVTSPSSEQTTPRPAAYDRSDFSPTFCHRGETGCTCMRTVSKGDSSTGGRSPEYYTKERSQRLLDLAVRSQQNTPVD
ncbi:hypothetical protein BaRGS_00005783 [Batillaria attramentaria]|uniref:Uncharacterized protein n=1 Tax=Batillaria attramentaria TaxID=370345 RepID=A0ABD0LW26_9CAEN